MNTPVAAAAHLSHMAALATRTASTSARMPVVWVPGLVLPLVTAAVMTSAFGPALAHPGFAGVDSFASFVMPATIVQGVVFAAVAAGTGVAIDLENGFFDRLLLSPAWRPALLLGRLGGAAALAAAQTFVFTTVFAIFGTTVRGGVRGFAVLLFTAVVLAVGVGALAVTIALRTGHAEAVQNSFPLLVVLLFTSTAFFPAAAMSDWYRVVAQRNPMSWIIDGMRTQVVEGWTAGATVNAAGVSALLAVTMVLLALTQFRRRTAAMP